MFAVGFGPALQRYEKGSDLFFRGLACEKFDLNVFPVVGDFSLRLLGEVVGLIVAPIDPGIEFGKADADDLCNFFMAFDGAHHGTGLDAAQGRLRHAGFFGNLDEGQAFFLSKLSDALSQILEHAAILIIFRNLSIPL